MTTEEIIALGSMAAAFAAVTLALYEGRATREHNRRSVLPILQIGTRFRRGETAGILLTNVGLGPAAIVETRLRLDGKLLGPFDKLTVDKLRDQLSVRPHATTLGGTPFLATNYQQFLLSVDEFDPDAHAELARLISERLQIEIRYQSIYGKPITTVSLTPKAR